jgi:hypothetical protein
MARSDRGPERLLALTLLGGLALWISLVLASNIADALVTAGLVGEWSYASGNLDAVRAVTDRHGVGDALDWLLFAGVLAFEALACGLAWRAVMSVARGVELFGPPVVHAMTAFVGLFFAFVLMDEVFIAYAFEAGHVQLIVLMLAVTLTLAALDGRRRVHARSEV